MNKVYLGKPIYSDTLAHANHKYRYKKWVNGKWRYVYKEEAKGLKKAAQSVGDLFDSKTYSTNPHTGERKLISERKGKISKTVDNVKKNVKKTAKSTSKQIEKAKKWIKDGFHDDVTYTSRSVGATQKKKSAPTVKVVRDGKVIKDSSKQNSTKKKTTSNKSTKSSKKKC